LDGTVLTKENIGVYASRRQYAFALVTTDLLYQHGTSNIKLHPVFGMIWFPTGGIAGASNNSLMLGSMNDAIIIHAIVHDAFGYCLSYQDCGPGYNYLNTKVSCISTKSPLCCQLQGIIAAKKVFRQNTKKVKT